MSTFMLGYSPNSWDGLFKYLHKKGYEDEILEKHPGPVQKGIRRPCPFSLGVQLDGEFGGIVVEFSKELRVGRVAEMLDAKRQFSRPAVHDELFVRQPVEFAFALPD